MPLAWERGGVDDLFSTCVNQERDTLMLFIISSGIYRITWVRTQGGLYTGPCMNQHMRMCLRLLEEICMSGNNSTPMPRKWRQGICWRSLVYMLGSKLMWMPIMTETWKIGCCIIASSSMWITNLSFGTVNARTQLEPQVLDQSFLTLLPLQILLNPCGTS